jgi:hypothetical protein
MTGSPSCRAVSLKKSMRGISKKLAAETEMMSINDGKRTAFSEEMPRLIKTLERLKMMNAHPKK